MENNSHSQLSDAINRISKTHSAYLKVNSNFMESYEINSYGGFIK